MDICRDCHISPVDGEFRIYENAVKDNKYLVCAIHTSYPDNSDRFAGRIYSPSRGMSIFRGCRNQ